MEHAIEVLACVQLGVIGLSHLLQPRAWVDLFIALREKGHSGVFLNAFLGLWFGALVVAFHNVWTGIPAILTALGWAQLFKASVSFVAPAAGLRALHRISPDRTWEFQAAGGVFIVISALLAYVLVRA